MLLKSATIVDPFSGNRPVPGAVITYSIVATVSGSGTLNNLVITDPIPAGTQYQAATMTLEAGALTDATDTDAGSYNGTRISVATGNVPAGQTSHCYIQGIDPMKNILIKALAVLAPLASGTAAFATTPLQLSSDVFVERHIVRADGSKSVVLEPPHIVTPGDNLVFVVKYRNAGMTTASNFVVTNPLPAAVVFNGTSDGLEVVSVDGGKSWGNLGMLRVAKPDGTTRPAVRADVTHIKWNLNQPLTAGAEGKLIFRGIVK